MAATTAKMAADAGVDYAQAYPAEYRPDARQRGRVSIAHVLPPSRDIARRRTGTPADLVFTTILAKSLLALALHLAKEWLLIGAKISVGEINLGLLFLAAAILAARHRPWELSETRIKLPYVVGYAALFCAESIALLTAADKLSILRVIMLTQSSELWAHGIQSMRRKGAASTARNSNFVALATLALCFTADLYLNRLTSANAIHAGYLSILVYLLLNGTRLDLLPSCSSAVDSDTHSRLHALGVVFSVPFAFVFTLVRPDQASTDIPLANTQTLATLFLLALALHLVDPLLANSSKTRVPTIRGFRLAWPIAALTAAFIGITAFERTLHVVDFVIAGVAYPCLSQILHSDPRLLAEAYGSSSSSSATFGISPSSNSHQAAKKEKSTVLESLELQYRHVRSTIKSILANPDSKKIYYFLCLNLAFMFVQMMYGIWTNSLGLISDSIHMFFDCLALGMGLLASVMATWARNETFTYGYARVEALSGFANGIFLILISIFIVFEAIQRLIDPPDMNTNQLLVISCLGLAVNLVGMFATGHHHHGHSHAGHDHGHSSYDHGHEHDDSHDHSGHSHAGHSHNMHGVFLHVMADTLGSVGVIISTLLINRYGWTGFDPIASIFIAVLIFASVVPLVVDSGRLLCLDLGEHREKDVRAALAKLSSVEGLSSYAAARFWPKDPATVVGSIHVQLAPSPSHDIRSSYSHSHSPEAHSHSSAHSLKHYANAEKVVRRVESVLKGAIDGLVDLSIQIEPSEGSDVCPCMVAI
ncbi:MAG: Putative zinc transporter msc2 [Cyphobasidiales sp. Tagirdzhanova-0007]|nr:MAG: Putative zinc transporter msc2 [Cyphobasidiales sp. Tagirdzhanova-0007]